MNRSSFVFLTQTNTPRFNPFSPRPLSLIHIFRNLFNQIRFSFIKLWSGGNDETNSNLQDWERCWTRPGFHQSPLPVKKRPNNMNLAESLHFRQFDWTVQIQPNGANTIFGVSRIILYSHLPQIQKFTMWNCAIRIYSIQSIGIYRMIKHRECVCVRASCASVNMSQKI